MKAKFAVGIRHSGRDFTGTQGGGAVDPGLKWWSKLRLISVATPLAGTGRTR